MLEVASIIARVKVAVPELRTVEGALEFQAMLSAGKPIIGKPFAHVVPQGLRGGKPDAAAGAFTQPIDMMFAVILTIPATNDATGGRAVGMVERLVLAVTEALVGWGPIDAPGVLYLTRAALVRFDPGVIAFSIEFAIADQLRTYP